MQVDLHYLQSVWHIMPISELSHQSGCNYSQVCGQSIVARCRARLFQNEISCVMEVPWRTGQIGASHTQDMYRGDPVPSSGFPVKAGRTPLQMHTVSLISRTPIHTGIHHFHSTLADPVQSQSSALQSLSTMKLL